MSDAIKETRRASGTVEPLVGISEIWARSRADAAATMYAKRTPTDDEVDRAVAILNWFNTWTDETGPCPISISDDHWHKKLCALCEWIAVLESENANIALSNSKQDSKGGA